MEQDLAKAKYEEGFAAGYAKGLKDGKKAAVKHGEWDYEANQTTVPLARCTACNKFTIQHKEYLRFKYCPQCGAKMKLPKKEA